MLVDSGDGDTGETSYESGQGKARMQDEDEGNQEQWLQLQPRGWIFSHEGSWKYSPPRE